MLRLLTAAALATLALAASSSNSSCSFPSLYHANLEDLTTGLEDGCFTSVDLVDAYLARIDEVNDKLHAVYEKNPDALDIAKTLDDERADGKIRGPLHGIPILVKDNIATHDKMNNTAGSYALLGAKVPRDSPTVAKLRAAGAVILGKTALSEWAQYRSNVNGTNGWSAVAGQVYGPYYEHEDPYGSSSGSGVASGLGLAFAALGTETHGSIVMPSNRGNSVGIKPSVGLTSRYLVVPISLHQDTVGPIAHTVRDAATVLSVIAGVDEHDNYTQAIPNDGVLPDYIGATKGSTNLTGVRIGVPRNGISPRITFAPVNESYVLSEFDKAIDVLRDLGAEIVDPANFSTATTSEFIWELSSTKMSTENVVIGSDFISDLAAYFAELTENPNDLHSVEDLVEFTRSEPREDWPDRDIGGWLGALELGFNSSDVRAFEAREKLLALDRDGGVTGIINKLNLSAVILPTDYAPTWAASPGLPEVTVPMGAYPPGTPIIKSARELIAVAPGIPFGLTFLGKKWSEETLIRLAYAYEQATHHRDKIEPGERGVSPTTGLADVVGSAPSGSETPAPDGAIGLRPAMPLLGLVGGMVLMFSAL
ncbi:amidase signature enzyme [Aspergillus lucknowensis]|uniref:Amidase signature enzyme n=1 Tax=Aspergillus lucknowensis TaxID=176173 RepID=A0ABR4M031_9EURO